MPSKFGDLSKAYTTKPSVKDPDTILDLYVLAYNSNSNLVTTSETIKSNLITYLNQSRMIGDTVNVKDAFIINICVDFEIITLPNFNNSEVLAKCLSALKNYFDINKWQINQPIILSEISVLLDNISGVQTVQNLLITNKAGTNSGYSQYAYDINGATQSGIIYPSLDPSIFEVKFPNSDIQGRVVSLGTGAFSNTIGY
jgi:phage-related baseplate assembly protein